MKKKIIVHVLCAIFLVLCPPVEAQQPTKIPRIGFQFDSPLSALAARVEGFRQGLRELGYVEGKNIIIEWRSAEGKPERRNEIAGDWARLKVEIIVTGGPTTTSAAKEATSTIPIVMAFDNDPVGNGFVASLARPGGNITGLSTLAPEISGKQLELLKEVVPRLSRVGVLGSSTTPGNVQSLKETELAAGALAVQLQYLDVRDPKNIESAFRAAIKGRADSMLVLTSPVINPYRTEIAELAVKEPAAGDILHPRIRRGRRAHEL